MKNAWLKYRLLFYTLVLIVIIGIFGGLDLIYIKRQQLMQDNKLKSGNNELQVGTDDNDDGFTANNVSKLGQAITAENASQAGNSEVLAKIRITSNDDSTITSDDTQPIAQTKTSSTDYQPTSTVQILPTALTSTPTPAPNSTLLSTIILVVTPTPTLVPTLAKLPTPAPTITTQNGQPTTTAKALETVEIVYTDEQLLAATQYKNLIFTCPLETSDFIVKYDFAKSKFITTLTKGDEVSFWIWLTAYYPQLSRDKFILQTQG